MVGLRGVNAIVTCGIAAGGMMIVFSGDADAARRGRELFTFAASGAGLQRVAERSRAVAPVVRRAQQGTVGAIRPPKKRPGSDNASSGGQRPDRPKPKPDRDPPGSGNAGGKPPRPPSEATRPPPKVVCIGGRIVRGACLCPTQTRRATRGDGFACIEIVRNPRPKFPVVVIPRGPRPEVSTFVPVERPPLGNRGGVTDRPPPPPRGPQLPPVGRGPQPMVPFVPTAQLADAVLVPDEVIFTIAATAPQSIEDGVAQRFNLTLLDRVPIALLGQRVVRLRIPDGRLVAAVVAALQQDGAVVGPQPNYLYRPQQTVATTSGQSLQYSLGKVELAAAHQLATGRGAVVAIIDTGVDTNHADLKDSGIRSFDAVGGDGAPDTHGTAIAGIISARGLTRGIAPGARVISVRAFATKRQAIPHLTTTFVLLKSLDWAIGEQARVLNLSFAGPEDPLLRSSIGAAAAKGVIMVAAAGNNGRAAPAVYPAAYDGVIAATAIDADDRLYAKANIGTYVAIAAPGVDVLAASVRGAHDLHSGTSFAAAHVSGVVALMLERNPALDASEVRAALMRGAQDLGAEGRDDEFGAGRINAAAALNNISASLKP